MDATRLIEEAGSWAQHVRQSPGNGTAGEDLYLAGLLDKLIAALKASEERNKATTISLRCAEANLKAAIAETEPVKSANLAANKRIVALEHERDAARAELAQPSICPNCTAKLRRLDRMDSAGYAAYELDKARKDAAGQNKRAQKAEQEAKALRTELARLTTPRPIAEAPRDGTWVLGLWLHIKGPVVPTAMRWLSGAWRDEQDEALGNMTHYLPLPEVKP